MKKSFVLRFLNSGSYCSCIHTSTVVALCCSIKPPIHRQCFYPTLKCVGWIFMYLFPLVSCYSPSYSFHFFPWASATLSLRSSSFNLIFFVFIFHNCAEIIKSVAIWLQLFLALFLFLVSDFFSFFLIPCVGFIYCKMAVDCTIYLLFPLYLIA